MFCEAFSINPEVATQLALFHRWYGIQITKPNDNERKYRLGKEDRLAVAATSLRQAGMMFHIVGNLNDARESFEKSAEYYSDVGNTYSFVMACCSGDRDLIVREALKYAEMKLPPIASKRREADKSVNEEGEIYAEFDRFPPNILLYFLMGKLTAITLGSNFVNNAVYPLVEFLEFYADQRVSTRGYPISQYLRLFHSLLNLQQNENQKQTIHQIGGIFDRMLGAYEESILVAQKDQYHWKNCAIDFDYIEPDIFALSFITDSFLFHFVDTGLSISEIVHPSEIQKATLSRQADWRHNTSNKVDSENASP